MTWCVVRLSCWRSITSHIRQARKGKQPASTFVQNVPKVGIHFIFLKMYISHLHVIEWFQALQLPCPRWIVSLFPSFFSIHPSVHPFNLSSLLPEPSLECFICTSLLPHSLFFSFHSNYPRSILRSSNHLCSFSSILLPSLVSSLPPCVSSLFFRSFVPSFISSSFCPFTLLLSPRKVKHITACGLEV